jgi:hypothetical protein
MPLGDDLAYRLRKCLKDNQKADAFFTIKDEKKILDKLKPTLRNCKYKLIQRFFRLLTLKL